MPRPYSVSVKASGTKGPAACGISVETAAMLKFITVKADNRTVSTALATDEEIKEDDIVRGLADNAQIAVDWLLE